MASLRAIRKRIRSVQGTEKITRAMKMVATSKLRQAQQELVCGQPFAHTLQQLVGQVVSWFQSQQQKRHPLMHQRDVRHVRLLVFTSERGLCGGFNSNLIRQAERFAEELQQQGKQASLFACGKKGHEALARDGFCIDQHCPAIGLDALWADRVAQTLNHGFCKGHLDEVWLIYTRFHSVISQVPVVEPLLPVRMDHLPTPSDVWADPLWEPQSFQLLHALLGRYLSSQVLYAALQSTASQHGARMRAMDSATQNAQDMIASLTLQYNRARQAAITKELVEIISGAEALQA
ncbi:MAG: ATP synthase F1 subunit gamma [Myxococcota bacterium]